MKIINKNIILENVFYINLEERIDRKTHVENELNSLGWIYERFNAIKAKSGRIGCSMSHLKLLVKANCLFLHISDSKMEFSTKTHFL